VAMAEPAARGDAVTEQCLVAVAADRRGAKPAVDVGCGVDRKRWRGAERVICCLPVTPV
jgi:hypothetical protein